jgi:hypothetical protein
MDTGGGDVNSDGTGSSVVAHGGDGGSSTSGTPGAPGAGLITNGGKITATDGAVVIVNGEIVARGGTWSPRTSDDFNIIGLITGMTASMFVLMLMMRTRLRRKEIRR